MEMSKWQLVDQMQKDFTNIQIKERNQRKLTSSYVESYLFLIKQGRKEIRK